MSETAKISAGFRSRLEGRVPSELVRAIVMFHVATPPSRGKGRMSAADRLALARRRTGDDASALQHSVDELLERHHAKRLADRISALGTLPVEAPAAEVLRMADAAIVRAILDDQPVKPADGMRPRRRVMHGD